MHKRFEETQSAVNMMSKKLWRHAKDFSVAGNKDKRGVTSQRVVIRKVLPLELMKMRLTKKWPDSIDISNIEFVKKPLYLGGLYGNHFKVALRFVDSDEEEVKRRVEGIKEHGFINYFGL